MLCTVCNSSLEATKHAIDEFYDFAFVDYAMPEMTGADVCRYLDNDCISIVITAHPITAELMKLCMDAGARGFMQKPINAEVIIKIIQGPMYDKEDPKLVAAARREGISSAASKRNGRITPLEAVV
jgi:CheY-like chemotaxis protein